MQLRIPEVTLLEEVGRGPGSVVFRALHHGSSCTVKLSSDRPGAIPGRAFEQDVLRLARLSRAGLPRVLSIGAVDDTSYAILDEGAGEPLSRVLRRPLAELDALRVALSLTSCLRQLHEAGFVHGALTPEHILISGEAGCVRLLDRGTVTRPQPFEVRIDTQALGRVLRECVDHIEEPGGVTLRLSRLAEQLSRAERSELGSVTAELEECVSAPAQRRSSYPPPSVDSLVTPLAYSSLTVPRGARAELLQLQRCWERTRSAQAGAMVGVVGAAGSGKSRLLAAFAESLAAQDVQVLSVRCRNRDWAPFSALKRLLDGHLAGLAALDAGRRAEIVAGLRKAVGPMASHARLLSSRMAELFRDAPAAIAEGDAQQVFVAGMADFLAKYLEWSGRSVVVLDDIHWLDTSSRLVLSRVAARLCPQGHLFVCGARDDPDSREMLERFRASLVGELVETVRLGSLGHADASQVISEYLGIEQPSAELVEQLEQLSDGTPLCLLELLRSTLERGHCKPIAGTWQLDAAQVQRMRLPASSQALIERRLSQLDQTTLQVLRAAAVMRDHIAQSLLAQVTGLAEHALSAALELSLAAHLLDVDARGEYTFVHDTVWQALLHELSQDALRSLHQRVAEALSAIGGHGADYEYALARHHASGMIERDPLRVFETNRRAARRALEAYDDALALSFLKPAERAAQLGGVDLGRELCVQLAETHLRVGDMQHSLAYFQRALASSRKGSERAQVRGRIAWIHHFEADAAACRETLEAALADSGHSFPGENVGSLLLSAGRWALGSLRSAMQRRALPRRRLSTALAASDRQAQALCELYAACYRIAVESGQPLRVVTSLFAMSRSSQLLGPCRTVVHAELMMAFFFATLGASKASRERMAGAERMARELGDPIAQTLVHELQHAISGWRGDFEESERHARLCVEERGHWMELGELCHVCFAMCSIESSRGRPEAALAWTERAIERVRQNGRAPAVFALIEDAAIGLRIALGREREVRSLERSLRCVQRAPLQRDGYFHMLSYQTRVQRFTESGELGPEFEALVREFDALGLNPGQVHLLVAPYYQHVAHARVHQCLRAEPAARAALLPKLERACRDVEACSRLRSMRSHSLVIRAAQRWFEGDLSTAQKLVTQAERLAEQYGCPWASYAVCRLRAHMLRAEGKESAALDVARIAALWARQYGQVSRLRFICEEFELRDPNPAAVRGEVEAPNTRRNLDALLRISQANSRELGPERQARLILDELLEALAAERALLFMRAEAASRLVLAAGRWRGAGDLPPNARYDRALVEQVYATGQTQLAEAAFGERNGVDRSCVVAALVLREQAVGVLYLDRPEPEGGFRSEDAALLQALAMEVSLALELGGSLREREQLQQNLQQAQKMEAIGRLAGGIAHDFNNMLTTIQYAATNLAELAAHGEICREDLEDIQTAARRGADLTRQLLGLSRGRTAPPPARRIVLAEAVRDVLPMLRRLVRQDVSIVLDLASEPLATLADLSQIERVLMNLCQNASDAMPRGGTISIRVAAADDSEGESYVLLSVSDTGTGMNDEVRSRLFEPFFTTKPSERGTGLGLANVYAIVQQCHGEIEVSSSLGAGSCFKLSLPRCPLQSEQPEPQPLRYLSELRPTAAANGDKTVLVVDDDDAVRRMVVRTLETGGYRVWSAPDGETALQIVDARERTFDLVVTDMHMPGMDGAQLSERLLERHPELPLLFVSGDEAVDLEESGLLSREAEFLHKPFMPDVLLSHVHRLIEVPRSLHRSAG
jgi:signal transduction histidine kinase/tetratricopeptide (TPR) repeat protein